MSKCSNTSHRSCGHPKAMRWQWETADGCTGSFCHECLVAVGLRWTDLVSFRRTVPESFHNSSGLAWMD